MGIVIDKSLKPVSQCATAAKSANKILGMINRRFMFKDKNTMFKPYKSLVQPKLVQALAQAFVNCRLDYCNSLLAGVSIQLLCRMQVIQNAGARFVTGARRTEHTTPALNKLHWLPVWQRIV